MATSKSAKNGELPANFRQLAITLSNGIGRHQIPIVEDAMHPAALITSDAIHYELVKKIFRTIYRANHCYHLNASIDFVKTFDALGRIQEELLNSRDSDIDQVNLLHQIGTLSVEFFRERNSYPSIKSPTQPSTESNTENITTTNFG